jgi:ATP-dependent helicase/nuclease subunit B
MNNIFNIPANYDFLGSVASFVEKNFSDKENIRIVLPNHRSSKALKIKIFEKNGGCFLPKINAISDISYQDFLPFTKHDDVKNIVDELLQIKPLDDIDYLFLLTEEIGKIFFDNNQAQNFQTAIEIKNFFDEIEKNGINLENIDEIDDSNFPKHKQFKFDFLKTFYPKLKNILLKNNYFSKESYQSLVITRLAEVIEKYGLREPLIIAGSTGSVHYTKKLIKSVSKDKNGFLILQNFLEVKDKSETSPQFYLSELVEFANIEKNRIKNIVFKKNKLSDDAMLLFEKGLVVAGDDFYSCKQHNNFSYIEAKNEIEEAMAVASILHDEMRTNSRATQGDEDRLFASSRDSSVKSCAVISNCDNFTYFLSKELDRIGMNFNVATSLDASDSKLVTMMNLLLELIEKKFDSYTALSILKHPLSRFDKKSIEIFEIDVVRKARKEAGLKGLLNHTDSLNFDLQKKIKPLLDEFVNIASTLDTISETLVLSNVVEILISFVEKLSGKTFTETLSEEPCCEEISKIFEKLKRNFLIKSYELNLFFKKIFSQIKYFRNIDEGSEIEILPTIEARLLNFDLVIISSLNKGIFPKIPSENWLEKNIGISLKERKYGQNFYDFFNHIFNKKVVLSRCLTSFGEATDASPFLLKFQFLCKKLNIKIDSIFLDADIHLCDKAYNKRFDEDVISPKPLLEFRPKKLAITDIYKLISNPYQIYAKKILRLKKIDEIDYEPGNREFGSFVHIALEEFIKTKFSFNSAKKIFKKYFLSDENLITWLPKFENIFHSFLKQNVEGDVELTELPVSAEFYNIVINGKIDRISINDKGEAMIIDYKTGVAPTRSDVWSFKDPQLAISAMILKDEYNITSLRYLKLAKKIEMTEVCKNAKEVQDLIEITKIKLKHLLAYFYDEENGYRFIEDKYSKEYSHLARVSLVSDV